VDWIYLSPHFDDAVFSCGGLLWEQAQAGDTVNIWTVCGGEPLPGAFSPFAQEHHLRWESGERAVAHRKQEDRLACQRVGAAYRYLPVPDCIYRRAGEDYFAKKSIRKAQRIAKDLPPDGPDEHLYTSLEAILGPLRPEEEALVGQVSAELARRLPAGSQLVCPLTLGGHADHRLTRRAAEALSASRWPLWYYADFPYVLRSTSQIEELKSDGWQSTTYPISPAGVAAWYEAMVAHKSQISTFWDDLPALRAALEGYVTQNGGATLWRVAGRPAAVTRR
jgi:LmbE family N-acetylglucosaminyl deacetylase